MPKNTLVINCDIRETRVALIEGGVIAELQIERAAARGTVGNIVLGKVTRVLPGMQAAFIDVGQERAAFLHVEDLIRPDDFEAYLAGGHRHEDGESFKGEGGRRFAPAKPAVEDDGEDEDPAWSPDGSRIAFATTREGTFFIYVMNADGTDARRLATGSAVEHDPTWSPDGRYIAFARAGTPGAIVIAEVATGGEIGTLGEDGAGAAFPAWH